MEMKQTTNMGVFKDKNQIYTENLDSSKGVKVYNERIVKKNKQEFRSWNPYRSKLAAAILNGLEIDLKKDSEILYLGAATGTTVSHLSDIARDGLIFAVENSPIAMKKLLRICQKRPNIIPILGDAYHPERYSSIVPMVDLVYQDISQRNQAEIFLTNVWKYLKKDGFGILMVKARSIDVSLKPQEAYNLVSSQLKENKMKISKNIDLKPYEKDHTMMMISV